MLEQRFDNVVYRMGFAATRREARQLVNHGHFTLNGKKANIPSMEIKVGDVIAVKEKSKSSPKFTQLREMAITTPKWITIDTDKLEGKIIAMTTREDVDLPVEEHAVDRKSCFLVGRGRRSPRRPQRAGRRQTPAGI